MRKYILLFLMIFWSGAAYAFPPMMPSSSGTPLPTCANGQVAIYNTGTGAWDTCADNAGGATLATDTLWDAAGDTVYGTGSNTAAKLNKGTAYQVYMMNSGATAPAWTSTLGVTGTRLTKGWFTDLEVTNAIAGSITGNAATATALAADPADCAAGQLATGIAASGALTCTATPALQALTLTGANSIALGTSSSFTGSAIFNNSTNNNMFTVTSGVSGANIGWILPTAAPGGANYLLNVDADGTMDYIAPASLNAGTASNLSGTPTLPNGTLATTQAKNDDSTKLATTAFVQAQTNTATSAGIVATGAGAVNKVWKTDAGGIPGWRDDSTGGTPTFDTVGGGTNLTAAMVVGAGSSLNYETSGTINASGYKGNSTPTAAMFGYLDPTSSIQTQLNAKAPSAGPTFTGTVTLPAAPFTVGSTAVTTTGTQFNYLNAATGTTGTASTNLVFSASPTFTGTPVLPTPFTLGATSVTSTGAQLNYLASATGTTGTTSTNLVYSTSPTLVTPTLGAATATSINKMAITAPATSSTMAVADGKTFTASNTVTLTATDGSTLAIGTGGTLGTAAYTAATAYQGAHASLTSIAGLNEVAGGIPYTTAADTWAIQAAGSTGQLHRSGGTGAPTWTTTTYPATNTAYTIPIATATNTMGELAVGTTGKLLRGVTGAVPAWSTVTMPDTAAAGSVLAANSANVLSAVTSASGTYYLRNVDGTITWAAPAGTGDLKADGTIPLTANWDATNGGANAYTITAGGFIAKKATGTAGTLRMYEANSDDLDTAGFRGPASIGTPNTSYEGQFPNARPASGTRNALTWNSTATGGDGTPATPYYHPLTFVDLDTTYLALAGGTLTGTLTAAQNSGANPSLIISQSSNDPTGTPTNGSLWVLSSGVYAQYGGAKHGPFAEGAPSFSTITTGTNTTALHIGTSGTLDATGTGTITATAAVAANEASDATSFPLFVTAATGSAFKTNTGYTFNAVTGLLTVPLISTGSLTITDATDDNYIAVTNNSGGRAPTASAYELYPDAGVWKMNTNGTENTIPKLIVSGTKALATSEIASGACTSAQDAGTATGVATTDIITWGFNTDPTAITGFGASASGGLFIYAYPTSDHVNFKVCNNTAGAITPGAMTLNWRVMR
jgi:hypothetical protein